MDYLSLQKMHHSFVAVIDHIDHIDHKIHQLNLHQTMSEPFYLNQGLMIIVLLEEIENESTVNTSWIKIYIELS